MAASVEALGRPIPMTEGRQNLVNLDLIREELGSNFRKIIRDISPDDSDLVGSEELSRIGDIARGRVETVFRGRGLAIREAVDDLKERLARVIIEQDVSIFSIFERFSKIANTWFLDSFELYYSAKVLQRDFAIDDERYVEIGAIGRSPFSVENPCKGIDYVIFSLNIRKAFKYLSRIREYPLELQTKTKAFLESWGYNEVGEPEDNDIVVYFDGRNIARYFGIWSGDEEKVQQMYCTSDSSAIALCRNSYISFSKFSRCSDSFGRHFCADSAQTRIRQNNTHVPWSHHCYWADLDASNKD